MEKRESIDSWDGKCLGKFPVTSKERKIRGAPDRLSVAETVEKESDTYNMRYPKRGKCLMFYYSEYAPNQKLEKRNCAEIDALKVKKAFKKLQFEVEEFHNFSESELMKALSKVVHDDHSDEDCLAIVFMSHGQFDEMKNKQYLHLYDSKIEPEVLWQDFCSPKCPSLLGKPKLVFIQACRGMKTDQGFVMQSKALPCETDSEAHGKVHPDGYSVPSYADLLVMWASFPGYYAFKSSNSGINGSVFIHFLAEVLQRKGKSDSLASLIYEITRRVAYDYESYTPGDPDKDFNKQIPHTESTLLRHIFFSGVDRQNIK